MGDKQSDTPKNDPSTTDSKPKIWGLTGEAAAISVGKRAKKRMAEEKRRQEEEEQQLKERILKAKLDHEAEKKRKEVEEKKMLKK